MKLTDIALAAATIALIGIHPASAQYFDGLKGKKLRTAIAAAQAHPLGSQQNPVRARGPEGERAYLARLRCADGNAPAFARVGSTGIGPYHNILDLYTVQCAGAAPLSVYLDMYHKHAEPAALPGFTIVAP
ncbi:hypothetical protein J2Y54_002786 [Sphingomonas sp. BE123]|jgi:hypothetical protein|uniref:hypothetical protein n=1 Tax=unclassified Sphingomonas TaxID=196159 RepID=UPI00285E3995|nr:hypothetical protein [Sphingomonas sp. BE123]MDR6853266.1 hypothetical protein [Sphingomonas sp. BE123]